MRRVGYGLIGLLVALAAPAMAADAPVDAVAAKGGDSWIVVSFRACLQSPPINITFELQGPRPGHGSLHFAMPNNPLVTKDFTEIASLDEVRTAELRPTLCLGKGGSGRVLVLKVEPGTYALRRIQISFGSQRTHLPGALPSFEVRPGRTVYLGEFATPRQVGLGGFSPRPDRMLIQADRRERDLPLALGHEPGLPPLGEGDDLAPSVPTPVIPQP